ncbi:MAG TPA: hypothetical protein VFX79_02235 [Candidatus Saccharimonadales bacterium]|nr:hypothetical protein [Candidatus Saccharimonadales bacterium]
MKKTSLFAFLLLGSLGFFNIFSTQSAEAVVTGTFPRDNNWVLLSKYNCPGHCLDTPSASFRVFYNTNSSSYQNNNNFSVTIQVICRGGTSKPGGGMKFGSNGRKDWHHCNGALSTSPNYSISQTIGKGELKNAAGAPGLTSQYKYADLNAKVGNNSADIIAIIVHANNGGKVTFEEVPGGVVNEAYGGNSNNYTGHGSGPQNGPYPDLTSDRTGTAFAMFQNTGGSYSRNFDLFFKADCRIEGNTPVKLRWYDADKNTGTNPHDLKFDLYDQTAGDYVFRNYESGLGGNDSYRHKTFTIKPDHQYKWTWKGVSNTNGIQIWMPFNEFAADIECSKPAGKIHKVQCNNIRISGYDTANPSKNVRFILRKGNGSGVITKSDNKWSNNNPKWYTTGLKNTFKSAYPNKVTLDLLVDIENDGSFVKVDTWKGAKPCGSVDPNIKTRCNFLQVTDGSGLYTTPNGKQWETRTYVRVTDGHGPNHAFTESHVLVHRDGQPGSPQPVIDQTKTWNYTPKEKRVKIEVTRKYRHLNGSNWVLTTYDQNTTYHTCYTASCSLDITSKVETKPDGVKGGEGFEVNATVTDLAGSPGAPAEALPLYFGIDGHPLVLSTDGGSPVSFWTGVHAYYEGGENNLGGDSLSVGPLGVTAPNTINHYNISASLHYNGLFWLDGCTTNFDVYKQFDLSPHATSVTLKYDPPGPDPEIVDYEEPNKVVLSGSVNNTAPNPATVSIPVTRTITKDPPGHHTPYSTDTDPYSLGNQTITYSAGVSNPQLGDQYCGEISVAPAHGWQGPGGSGDRYVIDSGRSDGGYPDNCDVVANRPYLRAYGADVTAGSRFIDGNGACNSNPSPIKGYLSSRPNKSGAGSQLAAIAMQAIEGFRTASLRTSAPTAPDGLSFGNEDPADGHYQGTPICSTDFYNETQADEGEKKNVVSSGSLTPHSHPGYDQTLYDGNLVLNGTGGSPFNGKKIIYVNGNVRITSDIAFNGFADPLEAPSFTLVASGNIYISKNVNRLDGIYVAQARGDGSGGTIYTCSKATEFDQYRAGSTELLDNCYDDAQLTVNGAFIANDVEFLRVYKSVRDSEDDHLETASNTDAAEVFNYTPEIYLSPPPFAASSSSIDTQFYTTLPPIL